VVEFKRGRASDRPGGDEPMNHSEIVSFLWASRTSSVGTWANPPPLRTVMWPGKLGIRSRGGREFIKDLVEVCPPSGRSLMIDMQYAMRVPRDR
jgi:hypothetical protein